MNAQAARRTLGLLDLTSLNDADAPPAIDALCARAVTPHGAVAAVCIWPRFVAQARGRLRGGPVRIATVVNFPGGEESIDKVTAAIAAARADGADEIDIVLPYRRYLANDTAAAGAMLDAARAACGDGVPLKVILESGAFPDQLTLGAASRFAILHGADYIKTSTGKIAAGATLAAARTMLEAIAGQRRRVGFKASGGIRSVSQAADYLALADEIMGPGWAAPETFRFGASGLLDDVLATLGGGPAGAPSTKSLY